MAARILGRRFLSTPAAAAAGAAKNPVVPLKLFGIHARYASAAYIAGSKAGKLAQVESELLAFQMAVKKSAQLGSFVKNPTIARDVKVAAIAKLYETSKNTTHVTKNTLAALAGNARLGELDKVIDAFVAIMKAERKEVDAIITSAEPLSKAQTESLNKALLSHLKPGEKINLTTSVNAALMGGLTVQIGNNFLDLSAMAKMQSLERQL